MTPQQIAKEFISSLLTPPLLHGDDAHRQWLADELRKHEQRLAEMIDEGFQEQYYRGIQDESEYG